MNLADRAIYHPPVDPHEPNSGVRAYKAAPLAAIVTATPNDAMVHLCVFSQVGTPFCAQFVPVRDSAPANGSHWCEPIA